ncbi:MAG: thiol peroxidase [Calditrichaeota bacterium]|nr:thiol peroxidase [Calditrichota bacterium]HQU71207.1 thiol peroxidase [Calditrichia bacterium]
MSSGRTMEFGGKPRQLLGNEVRVGDKAPNFTAVDLSLQDKSLADFAGKVLILSAVPSIDTGVCDTETRRFNEIAGNLSDDVAILTVSMDLPFAQKRWCGAAGIDKVTMLSDHREGSFGKAYGVLLDEIRLFARCVFVVDKGGVVRYVELTEKIGMEPDYDKVVVAVKELL